MLGASREVTVLLGSNILRDYRATRNIASVDNACKYGNPLRKRTLHTRYIRRCERLRYHLQGSTCRFCDLSFLICTYLRFVTSRKYKSHVSERVQTNRERKNGRAINHALITVATIINVKPSITDQTIGR